MQCKSQDWGCSSGVGGKGLDGETPLSHPPDYFLCTSCFEGRIWEFGVLLELRPAAHGVGARVSDLVFGVWGVGFRVWGVGFKVWGVGVEVWGFGVQIFVH